MAVVSAVVVRVSSGVGRYTERSHREIREIREIGKDCSLISSISL
jgi:hypothetical protein